MQVRDFLSQVEAELAGVMPREHRGYTARLAFSLFQFHYGDPRIHYECWVQRKTGLLEIGLHFEGHREFSYGWAAALASRLDEVMDGLTPAIELEEWTESWARLHERWPADSLDEGLARGVANRLADYAAVLQPILGEIAPRFAHLQPPPRTPRRRSPRAARR